MIGFFKETKNVITFVFKFNDNKPREVLNRQLKVASRFLIDRYNLDVSHMDLRSAYVGDKKTLVIDFLKMERSCVQN